MAGGAGALYGVSCPSPGDCTLTGEDGTEQPVYLTERGGTWGRVTEVRVGADAGGGVSTG